MGDALPSKWYLGNYFTVVLAGLALVAAILNAAVGGARLTAGVLAALWFLFLLVGYGSVITFYLDVQRIRLSDSEWNPRAWLYVLGYIFLSPLIPSIVYLHYRGKAIDADSEEEATTVPAVVGTETTTKREIIQEAYSEGSGYESSDRWWEDYARPTLENHQSIKAMDSSGVRWRREESQ